MHFPYPVVMGKFELKSLLSQPIEDLLSFTIGHETCCMFSDEALILISLNIKDMF